MIIIYDSADMQRVLAGPIDPDLKAILLARLDLLKEYIEWDLADLANFVVVGPGDSIKAIEAELGFSPFVNFVDGARYPDPAFTFSCEWLIAHGPWFETMFTRSDAGVGIVLLVPNRPDVEPTLLNLFNDFATWRPSDQVRMPPRYWG